ncbi:PAS domain-containing protein [Streptomyces phaeochromogenes]|uniref:PAS domain-containing protein n=1 Tax=Streptomyces phaeochromogenes TaxID=1923 RepID=A0ABZ1HBP2_STRPH|nr:PAS domain-containing protein [Streptomyces phaeochromogenes]MCX5603678.1 PAS domain-containing protein [Streptomyces phaeochromogenes]WSD15975.1 PAS domain-containing protein [Streptomyces phaeochromogenes]WSJ07195.1 PAS domain-containing protein [Streptomyces phaeochromogenes]
MSASRRSGTTDELGPQEPERDGADLLAALLDGMDAALCAFDADGVVTHWNREAERILGWTAAEAVGRQGFAGWAVRPADAEEVEGRLLSAMQAPGRQVHEFALLTKDGGRVLVRTQSAAVPGPDGKPAGVYCAFSEVHAQIDLERSIALSEALFDDASWGVVLVDADLRPAVVNAHAARAFGAGRTAVLGRPLGELLAQGVEELESALTHVLAEGAPPAPAEMWVAVRTAEGEQRRCWRSGFLRLASPLAEEPVPLGVGWLFQDVTEAKQTEQEAALLRFRTNQLHRAARAAAECEDPAEAASVHLDFALAGFADHALIDRVAGGAVPDGEGPVRLVRAAATPSGAPGPSLPAGRAGLPVRYADGHPALQCVERIGSVRASAGAARAGAGASEPERAREWAVARQWPPDSVHALCAVLRSRGRTLGVVTFLRGASRTQFERLDATYAEDVAVRIATALDLGEALGGRG